MGLCHAYKKQGRLSQNLQGGWEAHLLICPCHWTQSAVMHRTPCQMQRHSYEVA
jgi:hypothetical protein